MPETSFLSDDQEQQIIQAIARAEKRTSGEIRVHIENSWDGDALDRARAVFHDLGMDETEQLNGILIYIASDDHKAAVFAGKGIHEQVENNFWDDVLQILLKHFKKDEFEEGIEEAVNKVGLKLTEIFPYQREDLNELTNEISYNENREEE